MGYFDKLDSILVSKIRKGKNKLKKLAEDKEVQKRALSLVSSRSVYMTIKRRLQVLRQKGYITFNDDEDHWEVL